MLFAIVVRNNFLSNNKMVQVYKLNVSGRGRFLIPSASGGRRVGFQKSSSCSTNGKGLLLSKDLGGFGVAKVPKQVGYIQPPVLSSQFQQKLSGLSVRGNGVKKQRTISFKM